MKIQFEKSSVKTVLVFFKCKKCAGTPNSYTTNPVLKFVQRCVDGKHLMRLQSENAVLKFLQRSVDGKHLIGLQSENAVL